MRNIRYLWCIEHLVPFYCSELDHPMKKKFVSFSHIVHIIQTSLYVLLASLIASCAVKKAEHPKEKDKEQDSEEQKRIEELERQRREDANVPRLMYGVPYSSFSSSIVVDDPTSEVEHLDDKGKNVNE